MTNRLERECEIEDDFLEEILETTRRGIEGLWVFPGSLVKHPVYGLGIVCGHVSAGSGHGKTTVTEVEWVDQEPIKVTRGREEEIELVESSKPTRGLPTLQPWVRRRV